MYRVLKLGSCRMNEASDIFCGGFSISRTDLLWRESVGVCESAGETGGDVATNETTSRSGVIGITCEHQGDDSRCHKQQYTGGHKENFFSKCHLSLFFARLLTFRPCEAGTALTAQHWAACCKVNTFYR